MNKQLLIGIIVVVVGASAFGIGMMYTNMFASPPEEPVDISSLQLPNKGKQVYNHLQLLDCRVLRIRENTEVPSEADIILDDYHSFLEVAQGNDVFFFQAFLNHTGFNQPVYQEVIALLVIDGNKIAYTKEFNMFATHIDTLKDSYSIWDDPIFIEFTP